MEGVLLSFPEVPLQAGGGGRQVLLDAPTCSRVSHRGGSLFPQMPMWQVFRWK